MCIAQLLKPRQSGVEICGRTLSSWCGGGVKPVGVGLILIDVERQQERCSRVRATPNCCDGKRLIVARRRQETELGENSSRTPANQQLRMMQFKPTWRRDKRIRVARVFSLFADKLLSCDRLRTISRENIGHISVGFRKN